MIDDYGNTWTAAGSAQISTAQFKFGSSSLLLNGSTDYVKTVNIPSLYANTSAFTIECFVRFAALPTAGNNMYVLTPK